MLLVMVCVTAVVAFTGGFGLACLMATSADRRAIDMHELDHLTDRYLAAVRQKVNIGDSGDERATSERVGP